MAIDLVHHAYRKTRITSEKLLPPKHSDSFATKWQIMVAYSIDAYVTFITTMLCMTLMSISTSRLMISETLVQAHRDLSLGPVAFLVFPILMTGYFFFCHFFNQGQTIGQLQMKIRIEVPELAWKPSLRWALASSFNVFTLGFLLSQVREQMQKNGYGSFRKHDYLHFELMQIKEVSPVSLVELAETFAAQEAAEEFKEAA